MPRSPNWTARATEPTEIEQSQLHQALPTADLQQIREDTQPTAEEIAALRCPPIPAPMGFRWSLLVPALLLWILWLLVPNPTVVPPITTTSVAPQQLGVALGPSIRYQLTGVASTDRAPDGRHRIHLERGAVHVEVDPTGPDRQMLVAAGLVEVLVTGTVFEVVRIGEHVSVTVLQGSVAIQSPDGATLLRPDQIWSWSPTEPAVVQIRQAVCSADKPPVSPKTDPPETQEDPAVAFVQLLDLADKPGAFAHDILVEIDHFLAREDSQEFQLEARALRLEIDARIRPSWHIIPEIDSFIAENPATPRRLALLEIRATLARDNQDCEHALPTYRELSAEATGAQLARVQAWRGLCARQLGHTDEARLSLNESLQLQVPEPLRSAVQEALDAMKSKPE